MNNINLKIEAEKSFLFLCVGFTIFRYASRKLKEMGTVEMVYDLAIKLAYM